MATKTTTTKQRQQTRGGLLLSGRDHYSGIATRIGRSKTLVGYWVSGERHPSDADIEAITEAYGIPASAWTEPASTARVPSTVTSTGAPEELEPDGRCDDETPDLASGGTPSKLGPWLGRLARDGHVASAHTVAQNDATAERIGDVLAAHPELIAVVLEALRPHA